MQANDSYQFQGDEGERVPQRVRTLTFHPGIQVLPDRLCQECELLVDVTLPEGLKEIGEGVFAYCTSLSEINIRSTVESVERNAFRCCHRLTNVEFEVSSSSPHPLQAIGGSAFNDCSSLQRIKIPSSVNVIYGLAFYDCTVLVEANFSTTNISKIYSCVFAGCGSLLTVSLPISLERICNDAFSKCERLVTVSMSLVDSRPINIDRRSFIHCRSLANIALPLGSKHDERGADFDPFIGRILLQDCFGEETEDIIAGLVARFDGFPVHSLCYDHASVTAQELGRYIERAMDEEQPLVDELGMTAFHVFFSTIGPSQELLEVLLEKYRSPFLGLKDANGKRPLDYLVANWTETTKSLLQTTLQWRMVDSLARWGAASWMEDIQSKIESILVEEYEDKRANLCNGAHSAFAQYFRMEVTSILEMALWKAQLYSGWSIDGTERHALDREASRCICGSHVVIPNVVSFLGRNSF